MATIHTTPKCLEFSYTSIWAPAACAALALAFLAFAPLGDGLQLLALFACALFCLFLAGVFMEQTQARIDLARCTVTITRKNLRKAYETAFPLEELRAVCLEQTRGQDATCYRVALVTSKGSIPLTTVFTSGSGPMHDAERIYVWLTEHGVDVKSTSAPYRR